MSDKASKVGGQGRPRDPEGVRGRVLAAGKKLFAEHGFAGTSLRQVAEDAGISTGLLQYHFGSKQGLYDAVREDALGDYIESQRSQLELPDQVVAPFLEGALRQYFRYMHAHPEWSRLATWSILEGDIRPWPRETEFLDTLVARVDAAKKAGVIQSDLDPELLVILVGSIMNSWLGYRQRHAERLRHLGGQEQQEEAYLALCGRLLTGLLALQPTEEETPR